MVRFRNRVRPWMLVRGRPRCRRVGRGVGRVVRFRSRVRAWTAVPGRPRSRRVRHVVWVRSPVRGWTLARGRRRCRRARRKADCAPRPRSTARCGVRGAWIPAHGRRRCRGTRRRAGFRRPRSPQVRGHRPCSTLRHGRRRACRRVGRVPLLRSPSRVWTRVRGRRRCREARRRPVLRTWVRSPQVRGGRPYSSPPSPVRRRGAWILVRGLRPRTAEPRAWPRSPSVRGRLGRLSAHRRALRSPHRRPARSDFPALRLSRPLRRRDHSRRDTGSRHRPYRSVTTTGSGSPGG